MVWRSDEHGSEPMTDIEQTIAVAPIEVMRKMGSNRRQMLNLETSGNRVESVFKD